MLELFINTCLTKKDKATLSEPMNTRHSAMFECFKRGIEEGKKL